MKKLFILIMAIAVLAGCSHDPRIAQLEERVAKIEKRGVMGMAEGAGANLYPVTGALIGGGAGALDKITPTNDKDGAIVMFNNEATYGNAFMPFTLDEAGGCGTEALPYCIDAATTGEWWELSDIWGMTLHGKIPIVVDGAASPVTVTAAQARSNTFFLNTLAGTKQYILPPAEAGMLVCARNAQGVSQILQVHTDATDFIVLASTGARTTAAGDYYGATASAQNQICVAAFDTTDWYVISQVGTWTEE